MELSGCSAIVTGASSGIGAATARALADAGASVTLVARREGRLQAVAADCRGRAHVHAGDVTDPQVCAAVVADVSARAGQVDVLVNNAGIPLRRHADDLTVADVERALEVNLIAAVRLTLAVLPGMRARGRGAVINVTSVSADIPVPRAAAYGASKAALARFSEGLAVDLAGTGVHVGVVSPGPIDTEIWERGEEAAQYRGTLYPPEVVADAIVAAIRREAGHVTAPRRYGFLPAVYPLLRTPLRAALARFGRRAGEPRPR